ncbi:alpha-tectorin-like [Dendropsophus ebraccatus]|uniref:alpha-tectorin-like n=1 Tax=Dendropsophus ebraccatus TaxID=150705 RepID=UPI003831A3FA
MGVLTLSVVFLVAALQWQTDGYILPKPRKCPPNSQYGMIMGCEQTCETRNTPKDPCTHLPKVGCKCKDGYILRSGTFDANMVCIKPEDCIPPVVIVQPVVTP